MSKRLIYLMTFVLALSSTANAAVYLWSGSASGADGLWEAPINWTVTDSTWTWPNEEAAAANAIDPNAPAKWTNPDTIAIDILNGDAVTYTGNLAIQGAPDGSTTAVLTVNNGSSLSITGRLATSTEPNMAGRGQIDILGGSTLFILGDGEDLKLADDNDSWGMLNIVDSTVDIADDLAVDAGEGHINISGSSIVNVDDFIIADAGTSVGTLDISGTTVINIVDDIVLGDDGVGTLNISGDAVINVGDEVYIADETDSEGHMTISGNATVNIVDDLDVGDNGLGTCIISGNAVVDISDDIDVATNAGSEGHLTISGNATVSINDELYISPDVDTIGHMDVNGTATLNIPDDLDVGDVGFGTFNIGEDATLNIDDAIYIASDTGAEGHMTISGNATLNIGNDLIVANAGGTTATLHISGNPTIHIVEQFYMNDDPGDPILPSNSQVTMDGGTVTIDSYTTFNDDNAGTAEFIMNGGSFYSADYLNLSDNLDGTALLTMNGGEMITGNRLRLGKDGGDDTGQVRIFMNGGLLQAEELVIKITDTQIIYTGGVFRIGADDLDAAGMQQLVDDGTIVIEDETLVYGIVSNGIYTELNPLSPLVPQMPVPADGAEGVTYGSTLSWTPGDSAATNDVYFGTTNPPAFAASVEAGAGPYYPGPLEQGTTYYWQVDAVEADGTTKYSGDVWSFTATTEMKKLVLGIRIAADSDDAEEDVVSGEIDLTSSDLEFMYDNDVTEPNDEQVVGIRFVDIGIPPGTAITSASVQFDADDVDDDEHVGDAYILIDGELSPNPGTFEDALNNITGRTRTTAQVPWGPAHWATQGEQYLTSDISSVIQEIVDQDGWASGNALVLLFSQDPANASTGVLEAEAGTGSDSAMLHIESAAIEVASQPNPSNGAEGVPLDVTLGWWPGVNAASHDVYFDTDTTTFIVVPTAHYLVDADSHSLPWEVDEGTISFDGEIYNTGRDYDFINAGASGDTLDVPDSGDWAKLSFDFDVDSVEFIYGGNNGSITVEARDKGGAVIDSFYQADTGIRQPAGPVILSGSGIRSLRWKDASSHKTFAPLDNILLTILPPPRQGLLGNTTQLGVDTGTLEPGTTYYWQVDTVEPDGTIHTGAIWSFTTAPGEATQPDPADMTGGVTLDQIVSWKPGVTAAWHDVYLGTTSPPPFVSLNSPTESSFDPGPLEPGTTYYWQVNEIEADAWTVYTGDIWSFSTVLDIPITDPDLVGWWKLDDEGIAMAVDNSGYDHYGTFVGDPQFSAGYDVNALDLDGDDYVVLGTADDLNFGDATDFSVALWVKTTGWQDDAAMISNKDWNSGGNTGWVIAGESGGSGSWQWNWNVSGGTRADYDPPGPTLSDGEWNHLCVTHDRDGMATFYFDGAFQDEADISGSTGSIDSGYPTVIGTDGAEGTIWAAWFVGLIDDVRIYNKVLTEAEIRLLANVQDAGAPDPADGATEIQKSATLSWLAGATAASHDVYLSTDQQAVIDGTALIGNQAETSYSPADLEKGATYYWRVDEVDADGTIHTGAVWSFTVTTLGR